MTDGWCTPGSADTGWERPRQRDLGEQPMFDFVPFAEEDKRRFAADIALLI